MGKTGLPKHGNLCVMDERPVRSGSRHSPAAGTASFCMWAPEMASKGGVQSYMWRLWEVLRGLPTHTMPYGISLNDSSTAVTACAPEIAKGLSGAGRSKIVFLARCATQRFGAPTAVVGHLHHAPIAWAYQRLGLLRDYVVVLHGMEAWQRRSATERLALRGARAIVSTTQYTARTCATVNDVCAERFAVIPLCGEHRSVPPDPDFALSGDFRVLFVGRLDAAERYKGVETLLRAVHELSKQGVPVHLHVVGDGSDRPRLESLSRMGPATAVTFWGRLDDARLQAAYRSAHVFAMPSAAEGFGIVFIEAMRHALPCIGGKHGGTPEVIADGSTGYLVEHSDGAGIAARLQILWSTPALRGRMASNAREAFRRQFQFPLFAKRWEALLLTGKTAADARLEP